jgi:hypothetical protein
MDTARDLASRIASLLRNERHAMAEFLVALADFDERKVWMRLGHASLFTFLHRDLGLSKGASHFRKVAAELIQRYPEVVEPLRDGRLCITSVVELARVITPENRADVLRRFFHASKQEAKAVAAEILPAESVPRREVVTTVSAPAAPAMVLPVATLKAAASKPLALRQVGAEVLPVEPEPSLSPRPTPPMAVQPLTSEARRLHVTVSRRFLDKLEVAREALSHSHPSADAEAILEAGLDLLIERAAKRKGLSTRPCTRPKAERAATQIEAVPSNEVPPPSGRPPTPRSRHIPADVRREVWLRDGGRCQARLESGEICGSTHRLQFDHVHPFALGGDSTVSNIRLACAAHNLLAARRVFGDALMDRYAPVPSWQTPAASR